MTGISKNHGLLTLERHRGSTHVVFEKPILEERLLDQLAAVLEDQAATDSASPLVLRSAHPTVFLAGAHLGEIAALDATTCVPYAQSGRRVVARLEDYPAPTVAAVFGSCSGGGFDIALACDITITGSSAKFEHPGVKRGLVTGWSGTTVLPTAVGSSSSRTALLTGRAVERRSLRSVRADCNDDENQIGSSTDLALALARLDPARRELWRSLRGGRFVDRFRASMLHKL